MRGSRGADRPSCLAMNPDNVAASAARRVRLLDAFRGLDEDTQADLLEATETMAARLTPGLGLDEERDRARGIIRQVYLAAGFTD